jgi:hypothetical protein
VQTILVPVTENSAVLVIVFAEDAGVPARELVRVVCTPGDEPRASIDDVNCTNLTVPVALDNIPSAVGTTFLILVSAPESEDYWVYDQLFVVAAGTERAAPVPVPNHAVVTVVATDQGFFALGDTFAFETFDVDCVRVLAGRTGPRLAVSEGALAATGANGLTLPVAGLTLLAGGGVLSLLGRRHS